MNKIKDKDNRKIGLLRLIKSKAKALNQIIKNLNSITKRNLIYLIYKF